MKIFAIYCNTFVRVFVDISILRILLRALLKGCTLLNLILFINQISIFNYNFIRMKNTVSFQRKGISIAMKCFTSIFYFFLFSLSSLAACVDKEPVDEEDVDPAINPLLLLWRMMKKVIMKALQVRHFLPLPVIMHQHFCAVGYGRNADGACGSNTKSVYVVTNLE